MRASHQPTRELARRFLLAIEARVARGQVGIPEPPPLAPTVAELVERFLGEYRQPRIKDLASYRRFATSNLRRALPCLGALRADAVKAADLDRLRDARRVRDARDRLIPDVAGDGVARADVIIEAIFENVEAKRALCAATGMAKRLPGRRMQLTACSSTSAASDQRRYCL